MNFCWMFFHFRSVLSIVKNSDSKFPFPLLLLYFNNWITFHNLSSEYQIYPLITLDNTDKVSWKKKLMSNFCGWHVPKGSSVNTVSHNHLLKIYVDKSMFYGSILGQTKHKPLRTKDFLRFSVRNCDLHLEHIFFFKIITRKKTLLCTSIIQTLKFLKVINTMKIVSENHSRLLGIKCCSWRLKMKYVLNS